MRQSNGFFRPEISDKCIECGKCLRHCPGNKSKTLIGHRNFEYKLYGHSNNKDLRKEAASGAITTELLKYMLDSNAVDYVVTAGIYQNDKNLGYTIIDKNNTFQLNKHSGSNYCPVNIGRAIKEIKSRDGRYAVVCLPCLSKGIDSLKKEDLILKNRIKYVITLLCNHVPSYKATDYLIKKYNIKNPRMIKYRGNGWFGHFRVFSNIENGIETFSVPFSEYFETKYSEFFWQKACINCLDHFGIDSDACMGDADFVKYRSNTENDGETIVFSNNIDIILMLEKMGKSGLISIYKDVNESELDWIYGPLESKNRASELNTKSDVKKILREEYRDKKNIHYKKLWDTLKRILLRIIRSR